MKAVIDTNGVDLYVINRMPTEQEFKEISGFIAQNKQKITNLRIKKKPNSVLAV